MYSDLKAYHFLIYTFIIHLSILLIFQNQTQSKIVKQTENLVLSFNLVAAKPEAAKQAPAVPEKPEPVVKKQETIKPKPVQPKKVIKNTPIHTQAKAASSLSSTELPVITKVARSNYENVLASWLSRYKDYPTRAKRRRLTGTATIYVKINKQGKLLDYYIKSSTGHQLLDDAVVKMIERASPLPAIPKEFKRNTFEFRAPVVFELN